MTEAGYQGKLIKKIEKLFPGIIVLKNDPSYIQGIPDLSLFYGPHWATLEVKLHAEAQQQPNQDYYVKQMDDMSFSAFIYPENEREVLVALQEAFSS